MPAIALATFNARYIHSALGLRYLLANLGDLEPQAQLHEFTLETRAADAAEQLLAGRPRIVGLSVYVWNAVESLRLAALLKRVAPEVILVLGGPEVSHEQQDQPIIGVADYVIAGEADLAFADLCRTLLAGGRPQEKLIRALPPDLAQLQLPYRLYGEEELRQRLIYVEAARGCPFRCEFCLSALDRSMRPFDLDRFLAQMALLWERGARQFKFVDRTFNLNVATAARILEFFLERLEEGLFLHFEVIPDHLPERLRQLLARFPPGTLQLEVGVQSFNPATQALISRRQNGPATEQNLRWLREATHAHLHADLIIGLPGEDMASFAAGFDRLWALAVHEIQVGLLKRLRGAPIARHTGPFDLRFCSDPPYTILATDRIDFFTMQRLARFARYWDLVANSGRFAHTLPLLLGGAPFAGFLAFSDWLFARTRQTHRIALPRLIELIYDYLADQEEAAREALVRDFGASALKGGPEFLGGRTAGKAGRGDRTARQQRHLKQ